MAIAEQQLWQRFISRLADVVPFVLHIDVETVDDFRVVLGFHCVGNVHFQEEVSLVALQQSRYEDLFFEAIAAKIQRCVNDAQADQWQAMKQDDGYIACVRRGPWRYRERRMLMDGRPQPEITIVILPHVVGVSSVKTIPEDSTLITRELFVCTDYDPQTRVAWYELKTDCL